MTDQPTACRTTRHCADHGFCHRCTPSLDDATAHLVEAIDAAGIEYPTSSRVYAQLAATVRDAARTAARQTTGQDATDDIGLCGYCGVPRENHHHGYVSTADAIAAAPHRVTAAAPAVGQPAEAHDTDRAAVLAEAIEAAEGELLQDDTGTPEDEAYNQGIRDAVAAINCRMAEEART